LREQVRDLLSNKDATQRAQLAQGIGTRLNSSDESTIDRYAAEELARQLAEDAVQIVREELSKAVQHCRFLPRDIAMKIAHDVDAVACSFLEVTEVFSEDDWRDLVRTVSQAGRVTIADRPDLSEGTVDCLVETGDVCVAATLIRNSQAPMKESAFSTLMDRFERQPWILELMVARTTLPPEIAIRLVSRVSEAAREKLARSHGIEDFTNLPVADARTNSFIRIIQSLRRDQLEDFARSLNRMGDLGPAFMLRALRIGLVNFFEAAMAVQACIPVRNVRAIIRSGDDEALTRLFERCSVPDVWRKEFLDALRLAFADR
jgi:uncharacterized protein (DUF2336 family)